MLRNMNTPEGDHIRSLDESTIAQTVENYKLDGARLMGKYNE
jgi:hypothetical protein